MQRTKSEKENDNFVLILYSIILLGIIVAEFMSYDKYGNNQNDYFSVAIGLVGWFGIFMYSQRIIDNDLFRQFAFIGLGIVCLCVIKQLVTNYNLFSLIVGGVPLLFVGYFRFITYLFYKDYPNLPKKPTIIFSAKHGQSYYNSSNGYVPTMKEKLFSLLLFIGFIGFAFSILIFLKLFMLN